MVAVTGPPAQPIHALNKALCIELDVVPLVALDALNDLLGHGVVNGSAAHPTVQRRANQLGRTGPVFGLNGFDGAANLHLGRWRTWCLVGNAVTHQLPLRSTGMTPCRPPDRCQPSITSGHISRLPFPTEGTHAAATRTNWCSARTTSMGELEEQPMTWFMRAGPWQLSQNSELPIRQSRTAIISSISEPPSWRAMLIQRSRSITSRAPSGTHPRWRQRHSGWRGLHAGGARPV
jgi:hypothetical protein